MAATIDFAPLSDPISDAEVDEYRTRAKASGVQFGTWSAANVVVVAMFVPFALVMLAASLGVGVTFASALWREGAILEMLVPLLFTALWVGILVYISVRMIRAVSGRWRTWARLDRFARANGLEYSPAAGDPGYPGAIFSIGHSRHVADRIRSTGADGTSRYFDFGNFRYTTGSGKNQSTRTWGFLAFRLDRRLPHMVLDSRANNSLFGTNLPAAFDKDQVLSLEGDFDRYFTLYCPREYERDALYVFTPDLMALLVDEAAPFDVEIVDDWMFVYSNKPFRTGDAATYARLFRIMDTVGAKALRQTVRYADERVGDFAANIVAPQGARLKRTVSVWAILIGIAIFAIWAWMIFGTRG